MAKSESKLAKRSIRDQESIRRQHNGELIRRMRKGEALHSFDSTASWFPPRPIIKKDAQEIARLYGRSAEKQPRSREQTFEVITTDESA